MVLTLYVAMTSPPCHQVFLTAKLLNLDLEVKPVDTYNKKEHLTPEYLKINPQHTVPTLVDGDFSVWESRAISRYLVNKYGAGSKLYPQDPQARAVIDQRLDFDLGTLYQRLVDYFFAQFRTDTPEDTTEEAKLKKVEEALDFLNTFLEGNKYVAGPDLTLADVAVVVSIATLEIANISLKDYPNVQRWFELMKTTPGYQEAVQKNIESLKAVLDQRIQNMKTRKDS